MIRAWAAILLMSVLMQSFSRQVIFTEFLLKRDFIAQVLCEKKTETDNQCQGKCHLKKQLQQDTERQEKSNQQIKASFEVLFSEANESQVLKTYPIQIALNNFDCSSVIFKGHPSGIFHPPSC